MVVIRLPALTASVPLAVTPSSSIVSPLISTPDLGMNFTSPTMPGILSWPSSHSTSANGILFLFYDYTRFDLHKILHHFGVFLFQGTLVKHFLYFNAPFFGIIECGSAECVLAYIVT